MVIVGWEIMMKTIPLLTLKKRGIIGYTFGKRNDSDLTTILRL